MAKWEEYKVHLQEIGGRRRKSFTLVNAKSEAEARRVAEGHHGHIRIVKSAEKTGRSF